MPRAAVLLQQNFFAQKPPTAPPCAPRASAHCSSSPECGCWDDETCACSSTPPGTTDSGSAPSSKHDKQDQNAYNSLLGITSCQFQGSSEFATLRPRQQLLPPAFRESANQTRL